MLTAYPKVSPIRLAARINFEYRRYLDRSSNAWSRKPTRPGRHCSDQARRIWWNSNRQCPQRHHFSPTSPRSSPALHRRLWHGKHDSAAHRPRASKRRRVRRRFRKLWFWRTWKWEKRRRWGFWRWRFRERRREARGERSERAMAKSSSASSLSLSLTLWNQELSELGWTGMKGLGSGMRGCGYETDWSGVLIMCTVMYGNDVNCEPWKSVRIWNVSRRMSLKEEWPGWS